MDRNSFKKKISLYDKQETYTSAFSTEKDRLPTNSVFDPPDWAAGAGVLGCTK